MIEYPFPVLPPPHRANIGYQRVSPVQRSKDRVNGPRRRRRRFTSTPTYLNATFRFKTAEQAAIFESWLEHALVSATQPFICPLMIPYACDDEWNGCPRIGAYEVRMDDWPEKVEMVDRSFQVWEYQVVLELRKSLIKSESWLWEKLTGSSPDKWAAEVRKIWPRWYTDSWKDAPNA